jgi:CHAT domain-containing protein
VKTPEQGKAEALRQAQLAFIHGASVSEEGKTDRGFAVEDSTAKEANPAGFAHPFYWAPFVLIGNFQ